MSHSEATYVPDPVLIAAQNDDFRKSQCLGTPASLPLRGRTVATHALQAKGTEFIKAAVQTVGMFDSFEPDNDPDGYHDFGAFDVADERLFFKIDLFEAGSQYRWGAEQPDDPDTTVRVLTIMLASDW